VNDPIPPEKLSAYRRHASEREAQRQLALTERKSRALAAARHAATILKEQYGARRVVLYGSLAHGAWWREHSDIDLAAEGIAAEKFWRAWGAVERLAPGIEVNLAALEDMKPGVRRSIELEGIEL
jgi:predicted nucleotidyltransferase